MVKYYDTDPEEGLFICQYEDGWRLQKLLKFQVETDEQGNGTGWCKIQPSILSSIPVSEELISDLNDAIDKAVKE